MQTTLVRLAALLCFLAVALGAFGAHALKATLETRGLMDAWKTAVLYHFLHALALLVLAYLGARPRAVWWLLFSGIIVFSGSLYAMGLTNVRWLGAVTPLGGLLFLAGWLWLVIAPARS
jgi:uncharacterized membrane protein YgdD (TMEM256/DUF423 family)